MVPPSCFHILMASCGSKPITKIVKVRCCHLRKNKGAGWLAGSSSLLFATAERELMQQTNSQQRKLGTWAVNWGPLRSKKGEMNYQLFFFFCLNFPFLVYIFFKMLIFYIILNKYKAWTIQYVTIYPIRKLT